MANKRLTDLTDKLEREEALNKTDRFEDLNYNDNSTADISDKENERQQMLADELHYEHLMRHHKAEDLLKGSDCVITYKDKARWLMKLGYDGIEIKGCPKKISFEDAINGKYGKNVSALFFKEKRRLTEIRDKSAKYLFLKTNKN